MNYDYVVRKILYSCDYLSLQQKSLCRSPKVQDSASSSILVFCNCSLGELLKLVLYGATSNF